jgi:ABC-type lipoprotein export system ATPase subunit
MKGLEARHLGKRFGEQVIFSDVTLSFEKTGLYAIVGDSGSGKSTFLDLVSGIDVAYTGELVTLGSLLKDRNEDARSRFRLSHVGYLRQGSDLLELESALANVLLPLEASSSLPKRLAKRKALDLLSFVNLKEKASQKANTLSGGERQRVALARALVNDPEILLADEPTGALDPENAKLIYGYLHELSKKRLVIVVSHDLTRSSHYADHVLALKDGAFLQADQPPLLEGGNGSIPTLHSPKEKGTNHPPFSLWLQHGLHLLKAKKKRSLLSFSILSFSLLSLGLSLYVSRDLSANLSSAFTSLTGEGVVVMEKAERGEATFGRVISESEENVEKIALKHPKWIQDYGVSYLAPFESYFPDANEAIVDGDYSSVVIPSFGIRTCADFLWLDLETERDFYPECPPFLEEDQIVVGLPYSSMASICLALHIRRSYETLGQYLSKKSLAFRLEVANASWAYEDEQLLSIVAVTPSEVPTLFHYDHRWSRYLLEEKMRFPSSDEPDHSKPWILQKVFYLEPRSTPYEFMKEVRKDETLSPYVFERASYEYEQTHCVLGRMSELKRFYVFLADKHSLAPSLISEVSSDRRFSSFSLCAEGSYESYPEALASGFSHPFFLSASESSANALIDALSVSPLSQALVEPTLPKDAVEGSYLKPLSSALSFSSDFSALKSGRRPVGEEEVVLSTHLAEKWGHPQVVYGAGFVSSKEVGENLERDYRGFELKVVGTASSENDVLYAESYWPIDFYRDVLGLSAFSLEPDKLLLNLKDPSKSQEVISALGAKYPAYHFVDPSLSVKDSLSGVISSIDLLLRIASGLTLSISAFLLFTVALLTSLENRNEGKMLYVLGIPREAVAESYGATLSLLTGGAALLALIELFFAEYFFDRAIQSNFGSSRAFAFDALPFGAMALAGLVGLFLAYFLLRGWVYRRDFSREGR